MIEQALSDVKVIDLSWHVAGPCCTKLLADYGADVIKIERPTGGDPTRGMGPFLKDDPHQEKSGLFLHLNTNKRGVTLNLKSAAGKRMLLELVKDADILVESFSPGVMARLGLSYEELEKVNPRLIMTSISNFGQTGPYRDFKSSDAITFAMGGAMFSTGTPDRPPVAVTRNLKLYEGGWLACTATMAAWYGAVDDQIGEHIDLSLMEALLGSSDRRDTQLLTYAYTGFSTPRQDPTLVRSRVTPTGMYPAKDGWLLLTVRPQDLPILTRAMGKPELAEDPRFKNVYDVTHAGELDAILIEWLSQLTKEEACSLMQANGIIATPVNAPADTMNDPHFKERNFWVKIDHPVTGRLTYPGAPIDLAEGGWQIRRPAPLLGQHNEEIYCGQMGYSKGGLVQLREMGVI